MASPMTVELASRWIEQGTAERLLQWQRQELSKRQRLAASMLEGIEFQAHPEGPFLWLALPEVWRAESFIAEAKARNLAITGAEPFLVGHQAAPHYVRVSVASAVSVEQLKQGLEILLALLRETPPLSISNDQVL